MRHASSFKRILFLFGLIWLLLTAPKGMTDRLRHSTISLFTPLWASMSHEPEDAYLLSLEIENARLTQELNQLKQKLPYYEQGSLPITAVPANVIYRSPAAWNSSFWIDKGKGAITKNSPVVLGQNVVGMVDYVGKKQSRVRLITDSGLVPSVRVVRGEDPPLYLAKGELHGSSHPLWRGLSQTLTGVGFNYNFSDEKGPSRELHDPIKLIELGDLLVTTGMDGVFPEGLMVAKVTHVATLQEGDYSYTIEATPTAGSLEALTFVFVIPPLGYDSDNQPTPTWILP